MLFGYQITFNPWRTNSTDFVTRVKMVKIFVEIHNILLKTVAVVTFVKGGPIKMFQFGSWGQGSKQDITLLNLVPGCLTDTFYWATL
jgi:hypothetical protein